MVTIHTRLKNKGSEVLKRIVFCFSLFFFNFLGEQIAKASEPIELIPNVTGVVNFGSGVGLSGNRAGVASWEQLANWVRSQYLI